MTCRGLEVRTARTLRGRVTYYRTVYECQATRAQWAPLDEELGLEVGAQMTREVVSKVAWAGARNSYAQARKDLSHLAGIEVSTAELARVVNEEGARVLERQTERKERYSEPVASDRPVFPAEVSCEQLVVQADATSVLAAAGEEHKMVYCGLAFDAAGRYEKGGRESIATTVRYAASTESLEEFQHDIDALANRMGARSAKAIAFIADGAPGLWNMAAQRLPNALQIQDFYHVAQHLHDLAKALHGEKNPKALDQGELWSHLLKEGKIADIIDELDGLRKTHRGSKRQALDKQLHYLEQGRHRMDYKRYADAGWPIGSGAVESTCKHLVKQRLRTTGARWRRKNMAAIVALRLCQANEEWHLDFPPAAIAA